MKKLIKKAQVKNLFFLLTNMGLIAAVGCSIITPRIVAENIDNSNIAQSIQQKITVKDLQGFNGVIKSIALSPDNNILLVATGDGTINGLDLEQEKVIYSKVNDVNEYSSIVVTSDQKKLVSAEKENIKILSLKDGKRIKTLRGHSGKISDLALSPDDKMLVSVSGADRTIRIWDFASGDLIKTLGTDIGPTTNVAFTPDGKMFISGAIGQDRTLKFWDVSNLELIKSSPKQPGYINDLKITPDGKKLVAAVKNYVKVWDLATGAELLNMKGPSLEINSIAISPDNRLVATANKEGNIMLFDLIEGRQLATLKGHQGWVLSLVFSPDGRYLYSGAEDKIIKIWQLLP
ncbi:MAG TPA: WD40 repeat domain-containing protein [Cyanothece sp. UBA12306]|nr:WD40 repeat domain-containing protein [Cyanothece sp. UBA12306]